MPLPADIIMDPANGYGPVSVCVYDVIVIRRIPMVTARSFTEHP